MQKPGEQQKAKLVGAYVPEEFYAKVVDFAKREDRSIASLVRRALEREIDGEAA